MKPQAMWVRVASGRKARPVVGLYDTGSEEGLVRRSTAAALARAPLPEAVPVYGIGGGHVLARESAIFQVRTLGKWCRYQALVVPDEALDLDLLVGEDFLFRYGLVLRIRSNGIGVAYPEHFKRMTRRRGIFVASPRGR